MEHNNRTFIVTGASSGIGKSLVKLLNDKKFNVVFAARNQEKLLRIHKELGAGKNLLPIVCDVSKESDCKNVINQCVETYGQIDVLINNAGVSMRALFKEVDLKVLHELMDINFWGTVYCTKYAYPFLLESKGSIVGVSSIAGVRGLPGRAGYSASKFAMQGFFETLRAENVNTGLNCLIVCPGFTASNIRNTALNEKGNQQGESPRDEQKMMSSEEVALHIFNGIEKRKRMIVLTTTGKLTYWLNKFFGSWMDKMTFNHLAKEKDSPFK